MPEDTSGELPKIIDNNVNNNYGEWVFKSHLKLQGWDLWKYIEGPESIPPSIPPLCTPHTVQANDTKGKTHEFEIPGNVEERDQKIKDATPWMAANNTALSKIASTIPSEQIYLIQNVKYVVQAWINLQEYYRPFNSNCAQKIKKDIFAYQCKPTMDITQWLNDMQHLYSLLGDMGTKNSLSD
jgi:gag-polypeptide of LTR copia-type